MTKPANFPGRKNERRAQAVARQKAPLQTSRKTSPKVNALYASGSIDATIAKIISQEQATGVRTKKDRSNKARIA